jgi:thiol-disulfide isomerase/thioredoxin
MRAVSLTRALGVDGQRDKLTAVPLRTPAAYQLESACPCPTTRLPSDSSFSSSRAGQGLVLVDFWATWCGPCQIVARFSTSWFQQYAGRPRRPSSTSITTMHGHANVRSIPSILLFKDGAIADTVVGALPKASIESRFSNTAA